MARMITRQEAADLLNTSAQTISNWVKKGVLNAHNCRCRDGRNTLLIDRQSIEYFFDTLGDLASMEKHIISQKKTLSEESSALDRKVSDIKKASYLFASGIPAYLLRDIFYCVSEVAGDTLLCDREFAFLKALMTGKTISDLSEEYGITRTRVIQVVSKSIHKISTMKSWPECHREYKTLLEQNSQLTVLLQSQQNRIKQLESALYIRNIPDGGESAVPGYSKQELAEVLSRKLVDENLSVRCLNALKGSDIETVCQLVSCQKTDLLKHRNFGKKSLREIEDFLSRFHLSLGMDTNELIDSVVESFLKNLSNNKNR